MLVVAPSGPTALNLRTRCEPFVPKSSTGASRTASFASNTGLLTPQEKPLTLPLVVVRYRSPVREGIYETLPSAAIVQPLVSAQSSQNIGSPTSVGYPVWCDVPATIPLTSLGEMRTTPRALVTASSDASANTPTAQKTIRNGNSVVFMLVSFCKMKTFPCIISAIRKIVN